MYGKSHIMSTKTCKLCRKMLPIEAFGPDKRTKAGLSPRCTACRITSSRCGKITGINHFPPQRRSRVKAEPILPTLKLEVLMQPSAPLPLPGSLKELEEVLPLPGVIPPSMGASLLPPPSAVKVEPAPSATEGAELESLETLFPPSPPAPLPQSLEVLPQWIHWEEAPPPPLLQSLEEVTPLETLRQRVLTALTGSTDFKLLTAIELLLDRT